MDSTMATWWRSVIAILAVWCICRCIDIPLKIDSHNDRIKVFISGIFLSIHWISYFYALDFSNVAIALLTMYTFPAFTAIVEPIFTDLPFKAFDLFLACCSFMGVMIMVPHFSFDDEYSFAILLGLISSIAYVFRNIMSIQPVKKYHGTTVMFYQLVTLFIVVAPFWLVLDGMPSSSDWLGLIALAVFTTAIGHTFFVMSLHGLSATTASLLSCVGPVLAILWANIFLQEVPSTKTLIGGSIILLTVIIKTVAKSYQVKTQ